MPSGHTTRKGTLITVKIRVAFMLSQKFSASRLPGVNRSM